MTTKELDDYGSMKRANFAEGSLSFGCEYIEVDVFIKHFTYRLQTFYFFSLSVPYYLIRTIFSLDYNI